MSKLLINRNKIEAAIALSVFVGKTEAFVGTFQTLEFWNFGNFLKLIFALNNIVLIFFGFPFLQNGLEVQTKEHRVSQGTSVCPTARL